MSTYKNSNTLTIAEPYNVDAEVQKLQVALRDGIDWIDKSFGKAELARTEEGKKEILYPEVYTGEKRHPYQSVLPNNKLTSQTFFKVEEPVTVPEPRVMEDNTFTLRLSLICWYDIVKLEKGFARFQNLNYRFTELLLNEVKNVLKFEGVQVLNIFYTPEQVYAGYTINHLDRQTLKHPYAGFRIELLTSFIETCIP